MSEILGLDAKLYRNTGTSGSPTWDLVECVENVTLNADKATANVSTRGGGGYQQERSTLKQMSLDFSLLYDMEDTDAEALLDAYFDGSKIEMAVADGAIATNGTRYFRATMEVKAAPIDQPLEDALKVAMNMIVSRGTTPSWVTVSA